VPNAIGEAKAGPSKLTKLTVRQADIRPRKPQKSDIF